MKLLYRGGPGEAYGSRVCLNGREAAREEVG